MAKITIVHYLPRHEESNTKKLLDYYNSKIKDKENEVTVIDLLQDEPSFFNDLGVQAYIKRNYMSQELNDKENEEIKKHDKFVEKIVGADVIVLAYPTYNFTLPAMIKAFFDSILQKGKTWDTNQGNFIGLMDNTKMLTFTTSSGSYTEENGNLSWDLNSKIIEVYAQFMGVDESTIIFAQGMTHSANTQEILDDKFKEIDELQGYGF